jgi:hypothetical protein
MLVAYYVVVAMAIVTMIVGFSMALGLKKMAPGGTIGKVVNWLLTLIVLFVGGYFVTPFMPRMTMEVNLLFTASIFFFGGVFVVLVLWLIRNLISRVMEELGAR